MRIFRSEYDPVAPVDLPIHDAVLGRAAEFGDIPALIDGVAGTTVSYAQLDGFTRRIAAALAETGLRKGDVLALHSPNTIAYPAVFYGATRAGASVTTVHPLATAAEFAKQLRDSGARWIVTVSPLLETARTAAEQAGGIAEIFVCDQADPSTGHRSVLEMLGSTAPEPVVEIDPAQDIAVLPYSSGTTGTPKGVMLTHRNIATNLVQLDPTMPADPGDRILAVLPFFHIYGLTALMNGPLRKGATVVVLPRFELETFLGALEKYRIQGLYAVPPIILALAKHPAVDRHDLSALEFILSAAAPLDAELAKACSARLGVPPVLQAYGMTELSPGTHNVPRHSEDFPAGAVGKLLPSTEMRVVSLETEEDLGPDEDGELWFRGPQVMKGYFGRPEETDAMIDKEGWLHTGDIGRVDENGWLFVVDRVKELIKYKGYQVPPAELEAVLLTDPRIADAAVIGVYDEDGTEVPKAFVVPQPGHRLTADDVVQYVAGQVAPYKKVRRVEFVDAIPRAISGKILRRELRARERSGSKS
ncbi:4-coumarate--CoA ligase family protein [Streptomyces sp. NPDC051940]|uniref:4-coumarate--CoA ligase family protein n=1 Tax=Streptomyces sp. NPDC051940 TaxID=3155675 RepID=UPI00343B6578